MLPNRALPKDFVQAQDQPISTDIALFGGVLAKRHTIPQAGMYVPQHSHGYPHLSLLAQGGLSVWIEGTWLGDFYAPKEIRIEAHKEHVFRSLRPNTVFYCIHNAEHFDEVEHGVLPGLPDVQLGEPDTSGLSFQQESLRTARRDADHLMIEHAKLIGEAPEGRLAKNWELMDRLESLGVLHCTTARCNGKVFGYLLALTAPSLEQDGRMEALHTSFYTSPDVPGLGLRLQKASIDYLRRKGVDVVELRAGTRGLGPRMGTIYRRLGAKLVGESYLLELVKE